jgi:hypothetical protein
LHGNDPEFGDLAAAATFDRSGYMIYAVAAEFIVIIGLLVFMREQFKAHDKAIQTMADRIQAPERIPLRGDADDYIIPYRAPDEWNKVGEISIDPEYGLKDEVEFLG